MKSLSLKYPFAELISSGEKNIPDLENINKFGLKNLENRFILGKARLVADKNYENEEDFLQDKNLQLASPKFRGVEFFFKNIERFKKSIPAKENLNFLESENNFK
ncbi:MAG: hypothetical protein WDZ77_02445 [Candidatus Pacearchaeota archaeon]